MSTSNRTKPVNVVKGKQGFQETSKAKPTSPARLGVPALADASAEKVAAISTIMEDAVTSGLFKKDLHERGAAEAYETGDIFVGTNADGERVYVEMRMSRHDGLNRETVDHDQIEQSWRFSMTGTVVPKGGRITNPDRMGQTRDALLEVENFNAPLAAKESAMNLAAQWEKNHLNDMQAACAHQTVVYEDSDTGRRPSLDKTPPCEHSGYKYGHSWLTKELEPGDVESTLSSLKTLKGDG